MRTFTVSTKELPQVTHNDVEIIEVDLTVEEKLDQILSNQEEILANQAEILEKLNDIRMY